MLDMYVQAVGWHVQNVKRNGDSFGKLLVVSINNCTLQVWPVTPYAC